MTKSSRFVPALAVQAFVLFAGGLLAQRILADEPPVINPFGPGRTQREDAVPGYVELSDGKVCRGRCI